MQNPSELTIYLCIVAGIIISVILPIIKKKAFPPQAVKEGSFSFLEVIKPYLWVGLFSLVAGLLIFAFPTGTIVDWKAALLIGYSWDSTFQKIGT